jgi:hypothetical protein
LRFRCYIDTHNGSVRCAPSMRNPLIEGLKPETATLIAERALKKVKTEVTEKVHRGSGNGSVRCAPSMRNPLIEGLKQSNDSTHC